MWMFVLFDELIHLLPQRVRLRLPQQLPPQKSDLVNSIAHTTKHGGSILKLFPSRDHGKAASVTQTGYAPIP
jgi:hypothetical protein